MLPEGRALRTVPVHQQLEEPPCCWCHSSLPGPPGAGSLGVWLRPALYSSRPAAQGPMEGCSAAVRSD